MKFLSLLLIMIFSSVSFADMESTAVLPEGVRDPVLLFGLMTGLTDKFNANGELEGVTDKFHVQLMGQTLSQLDPQLAKFVGVLNASSNQNLGNQLSVGTLDLKSVPTISYVAPQFDYGLSKNFSIGIGVPLIHYHNEMSVVGSGVNNAAALHASVGSLSADADAAFNALAALNIPSTIQQVLAARGYQPIRTVDETNFGDVIVSGVYKYHTGSDWNLALRPFIQLPTGTKADPDDLETFATGGQPAVGVYSIHDYNAAKGLILTSSVGYQANIPDQIVMRVPESPLDILPGPDRRDNVSRETGNSTYLEGGFRYKISHPLELGGYYDVNFKDPDWYGGSQPGWDYGLLSQDTGSTTQVAKGTLTFSTTDWFSAQTFAIPLQVIFVYGQTIYAENAPNITLTQFYLRMFF